MRAKKFFLVAAGILMLAIAFHLGAIVARADFDRALSGPVVGFDSYRRVALRSDLTLWSVAVTSSSSAHWELVPPNPGGSRQFPSTPVPVDLDDIAFWTPHFVVTKDGVGWGWNLEYDTWVCAGPIPGEVGVQDKSISDVKGAYRK
jgi:hypothetical protein